MDDTELTRALARNVDTAFEALVLAHQDRIFTIALRMLSVRADAEEVAQDTFVRAYRAIRGYPPARIRDLALRPWLATIAINACRNRRRRAVDRTPALSLAPLVDAGFDVGDPGPTTELLGERRHDVELWARRLAALPRGPRVAIVLHHIDGLTYPEIASALGLPEGTIKAQVHRGLRRLRRDLELEYAERHEEMTA